MLRSLFTGISGLSVHQTMLDVTGNNIANVNTTGFKSASTRFEDTFSQLVRSGAAPRVNERGGMNPAQVGLGVKLQSITTNFTTGAAQTTGRNLDTMINGDGFFVLRKSNGTQVYTRNGSFGLDAQGQLVAADGSFVQGWMAKTDGTINSTGNTSNITLPLTQSMKAAQTTKITYGGNMPADSILADPSKPASADNAFAVSQQLTVYDDKGVAHKLLLKFERTDFADVGSGSKWKLTAYDADAYDNPKLTDKSKAIIGLAAGNGETATNVDDDATEGSLDIEFDAQGKLTTTSAAALKNATFHIQNVTVNADGTDTERDGSVATNDTVLDLSNLTGFAGLNNFARDTMDGNAAGTLTGFSVEADGTVRGTFSNGDTRALARIATASFSNPLGLEKAGSSYFVESGNSGQPLIGEPGTGSRGTMTGGAIEMSNVDLAQEFTNLILSQRGFQANSRVITTSDEILQELVNMKR